MDFPPLSARIRAYSLSWSACRVQLAEAKSPSFVFGVTIGSVLCGLKGLIKRPVTRRVDAFHPPSATGEYRRENHDWTGLKGSLTFHGVKLAYRRLFDRAGIRVPKKGAHTLRHTFATMWLRYGGGLRQLQAIMGHKHVETTMIYVHLAGRDVLVEHTRYSPVRTLGLVD